MTLLNRIAGHKANLTNPNTSEESKLRSQAEIRRLEREAERDGGAPVAAAGAEADPGDHRRRVLAGYKATLSNPNTSAEAKEHARRMLEDAGEACAEAGGRPAASGGAAENRHLGGLKAALANPGVSEEAKDRAAAELADAGYEIEQA